MPQKPFSLAAKLSQSEVKKVYNRTAWIYDVWAALTEKRARQRALALAGVENGLKVLEVAVGTGAFFVELVKQNRDGLNVGLDISDGMLRNARKRLQALAAKNWILQQASAFEIPYPDNTFDMLINCYMFDLLPEADMNTVLKEFHRVLRPGGKLLLTNMTEGARSVSNIYKCVYRLSPRLMGGCRPVNMTEKLSGNGFQISVREYVEQMLFPSEVILSVRSTNRNL